MTPKTAYYAHPMALYRSATEAQDIATLRTLGFTVVNPALFPDLTMDAYVKLAKTSDLVAFRAFEDGKIGSGVAKEIAGAREAGVPVIELPSPLLIKQRELTRNETRERMDLVPLRHPKTAPLRTVSDDPIRSHLGWDDDGLEMGDT